MDQKTLENAQKIVGILQKNMGTNQNIMRTNQPERGKPCDKYKQRIIVYSDIYHSDIDNHMSNPARAIEVQG